MRAATRARTASLPLLVTARDLDAAGVDTDVARRAVRSGDWREVLPGAWWRSGAEVDRSVRQLAALRMLGPRAALTGVDACRQYGMRDVPDDEVVDVVVPHVVRRRVGPLVRLHRTTADVPSDSMAGRRWTRPERAVRDAASGRELVVVRALVAASVADGWVGVGALRCLVDEGPRRGSAVVRRTLLDVEAGARSAPEAEAADVLAHAVRRGRLPPFLLNPQLLVRGRCVLEPDIWFVGTGLGAELDSVRHHGSSVQLDETLARHARAADLGITLVHRSPQRLRTDPDGFVTELERRLPVSPEPLDLVVVARGPLLPRAHRQRAGLSAATFDRQS